MSGDPADQVLLVAQTTQDLVQLKALKLLLEENEPHSIFYAPQLDARVWDIKDFGRLRVLKNDDGNFSSPVHDILCHFQFNRLPVAYHTLILTTTEG